MDTVRAQNATVEALRKKAESMGVKGVGVVLAWHPDLTVFTPTFVFSERMWRLPEPETRGDKDLGTNYLIYAFSKLAEALRTRKPSGKEAAETLLRGELGLQGAIVHDYQSGWILFTAFSGGTEAQDVEIAEHAMTAFKSAMDGERLATLITGGTRWF